MNDPFKIECEWWGSSNGETDISQACRGAIGINIGEDCLTRLEDSWGGTVRKRMHVSALTLAEWFAGNWWRLRWEPETTGSSGDVDWLMSHSMASAGGGFCWPRIVFASEGETIAVATSPSRERVMGPVSYLAQVTTQITAREFEREIDDFMVAVLARLHSRGHRDSELADLWKEVNKERQNSQLAVWRRLEALCGYDPDEAPSAVIELLLEDKSRLGRHAVEEVAAHSRHQAAEAMELIVGLQMAKTKQGSFRCKPHLLNHKPRFAPGAQPWQKGAALAQAARQEWNLGQEPVSNMELASILRTSEKAFKNHAVKAPTPMPLALRRDDDKADIYIGSSWGTSRRFATSRLLGQWLDEVGKTENLIPATEAKTQNQKFQRAFAQEFLCPFDALRNRLQTERPTTQQIEDASDHFGVSPRVVSRTLVNKGEIGREALLWVD